MFFKLLGRFAWKAAILVAPVLVRRARRRLSERNDHPKG